MRILILCTGNSCRSQMAEGFLRSLDERMEVHSAGTRPAMRVNPMAVRVLAEIGIDISAHRPKNVDRFLSQSFDHVVTVCDHARETCPVFTGTVRQRTHIGFEDPAEATGTHDEVIAVYRRVRDEIRRDFRQLYNETLVRELNRSTS